jgi:hypothetical protein
MSLIETPHDGPQLYEQFDSENQTAPVAEALAVTPPVSPELPPSQTQPAYAASAPAAPIFIESRRHWSKTRKVVTVGVVALTGLGVVEVDNLFGDFGLPHIGFSIHVPGFSTPPKAQAEAVQKESRATTDRITCSDNISFDIGSHASSTEYWFSGFSVRHLYGDRALECNPDGFYVPVERTFNKNGVVTKAVVSEVSYAPFNTGVDFNNPVICMNLSDTATNAQIEAATKLYYKEKKTGHPVDCNFGEETTGMGVASANTAAADTVAAMMYAQDAGALSPIPKQVDQKIIRDATALTREEEQARYPDAKIVIKKPKPASEFSQIEASWDTQGSDIKQALLSYHFENNGGKTELAMTSAYDGIHGGIGFPKTLSEKQIDELNTLTHQPPGAMVRRQLKSMVHNLSLISKRQGH